MGHLSLSFLGAWQVMVAQQPVTHFRSANNQALLVYLALQSDRPFSREVLATLLWPEEDDQNARNNLRQALYILRKLLGDLEKPQEPFLLADRQTVQFNPAGDFTLDVHQFLRAVDQGDLEAAVAFYQGELLPGFTCDSVEFESWLRQEREYLHQLALEIMSTLTQEHLQQGRLAEAQATARRQLSLEPWRELAFRQLMQAYALAGDRSNALAQFEACREVLWKELGVEPAPETVALYEEIQFGRYGSQVTVETWRPPVRVGHNLPADTTPFIGREIELAHLSHRIARENQRLVTIVGPGGIGKTRLALAVGADLLPAFRDGVYLIDLAPLAHPEEIPPAMVAALEYQAPDTDQEVFPQLLNSLRRKHLLLIFDNFEHLLPGTALVNDALQACPQLHILATSRQRLNLSSESRYELGGLDFPDTVKWEEAQTYTAVQLFLDSGQRARPEFNLHEDNVAEVVHICRLVQGMPLGLVLAAAWLDLLTPREIATEIERSLDFLAADLADLPPRQRSMQVVFTRSWEMMTPAEQSALANLSVFRGSFCREAAEQVAGANLRILHGLVNKSLLHRQLESGRFTMHELLRQFAANHRRQIDPDDRVGLAHCCYYARQMSAEVRRGVGFSPVQVPRLLAADRENIRRAWSFAVEQGLKAELREMVRGMGAFSFAQSTRPDALINQAVQALRQRSIPESDRTMLYLRLIALGFRIELDDYEVLQKQFLELAPLIEAQEDAELHFWLYQLLGFLTVPNVYYDSRAEVLQWWAKAHLAARQMEDQVLVNFLETLDIWYRAENDMREEGDLDRIQHLLGFFWPDFAQSLAAFGLQLSLSREYVVRGMADQGIRAATRGLNIAKGWPDLKWIGHAAYTLTEHYLQMNRPDQAALQVLDVLEWHLAIGQVWQTLGFLWSQAARYPQLAGGPDLAVAVMSMVYHHYEAIPHYRQQIEEVRAQFAVWMAENALAAAWEKGKALDFNSTVNLVKGALSQATP